MHISIAGKGGTGKTTLSALLIGLMVQRGKTPVLAVDADPNANLGEALGVVPRATISETLERSKTKKGVPPGMTAHSFIEYELNKALTEAGGFDLLVMGWPEGPGCYCFPNEILRHHMEKLASAYPYLVMDNEAGMEHLSRRVARDVDVLLVTSDATVRGVRSAGRIAEMARSLGVVRGKILLALSMSREGSEGALREAIASTGLELVGCIPYDREVADRDLRGEPLVSLPEESPARRGVGTIAERLGI